MSREEERPNLADVVQEEAARHRPGLDGSKTDRVKDEAEIISLTNREDDDAVHCDTRKWEAEKFWEERSEHSLGPVKFQLTAGHPQRDVRKTWLRF